MVGVSGPRTEVASHGPGCTWVLCHAPCNVMWVAVGPLAKGPWMYVLCVLARRFLSREKKLNLWEGKTELGCPWLCTSPGFLVLGSRRGEASAQGVKEKAGGAGQVIPESLAGG